MVNTKMQIILWINFLLRLYLNLICKTPSEVKHDLNKTFRNYPGSRSNQTLKTNVLGFYIKTNVLYSYNADKW